jgi:hypothetical protein
MHYFAIGHIAFAHKLFEFLQFGTLLINLFIKHLIFFFDPENLLLLLQQSLLELSGSLLNLFNLLQIVALDLINFQLLEFLLILLNFKAAKLVVLDQHFVELLIFFGFGFEMDHFELMVFLKIFDLHVQLLVVFFCDFEGGFDGFDLLVEFVHIVVVQLLAVLHEVSGEVVFRCHRFHNIYY